jgi:hypothetical protein
MTLRRAVLFALVLLPSAASAGTFYVSASRPDDAGDGLSWAAAKKTIAAGVALTVSAGGPHTLYVGSGSYAGGIVINNAFQAGLRIVGVNGRENTVIGPDPADFTLKISSGNNGSVTGITFLGTGAKAALYSSTIGWVISDCDFVSDTSHAWHLVNIASWNITITRSRFRFYYSAGHYALVTGGTAALTLTYCTFEAHGASRYSGAIYLGGDGPNTISNIVAVDTVDDAIMAVDGTTTISNSVLVASSDNSGGACIRTILTGVVVSNSNWLIASAVKPNVWVAGDVTEAGDTKTNATPRFLVSGRIGYIVPRVDDSPNFAYAQSLATILASRGLHGSFYATVYNWNAGDTAGLRAMVAAGVMEVGSHTFAHSALNSTGKIFDVTKAAETITINRAADTITLSGGGTVSGFRAKTLAAIKTELEGLGATVTPVAAYGCISTNTIRCFSLGEIIANGAAVNVVNILVDTTAATGLFKSELVDAKALLEGLVNGGGNITDPQTGTTYAANTMAHPFDYTSPDARTAVIAAGHSMAGNQVSALYTSMGWGGDVDAYNVFDLTTAALLDGPDEATVRANCAAMGFGVSHSGLIVNLLSHNTTNFSLEKWGWCLEEFQKLEPYLKVTSMELVGQDLRNSVLWTNDGDGTFSRTYGYSDYRLGTGSPLVNAGIDVGLTTDMLGHPIQNLPDIGAYELNCSEMHVGPDQSLIHYYVPGCASYALGPY